MTIITNHKHWLIPPRGTVYKVYTNVRMDFYLKIVQLTLEGSSTHFYDNIFPSIFVDIRLLFHTLILFSHKTPINIMPVVRVRVRYPIRASLHRELPLFWQFQFLLFSHAFFNPGHYKLVLKVLWCFLKWIIF